MLDVQTYFNYGRLDRLLVTIGTFPTQMKRYARRAFAQRVNLPILQQLRKTPPRRYWTGDDFVNDASRRAFFAKTKGKAYVRTGKYAAGWQADIQETETSISFGYINPVDYSGFVGGQQQVKGHIITGWPNSADVITANQPRMAYVFGEAISQYLDEQIGAI
jgi:hypothetical protein